MNEDKIRELEQKIAGYCVSSGCHHKKWLIGRFQCSVGRRHCHSSRVRRWLDEIKELEGKLDEQDV